MTPSLRVILAGSCYAGAWLAITLWLTTRRSRFATLALLTGGAFAFFTMGLVGAEIDKRDGQRHPVVVIAEDGVLLRTGNGLSYPARYEPPLHRGVEARRLFHRGDWLQIELAGGEIGWVPHAQVLVDAP